MQNHQEADGKNNGAHFKINIDLNLDDVYDIEPSADLKKFTFNSPINGGNPVKIVVLIQDAKNPFLNEFLNLAFGPESKDDQGNDTIDDFASVAHQDYSKALSTVLFCGLAYLTQNPDKYIGVDGSDFRRAYLYYRIIIRNYAYLEEYFKLFGVKYYARVLRGNDRHSPMPVDISELYSVPYRLENQPLTNHKSLFNYFLFYLK